MRKIWAIFKREFNQYFESPIAYLVAFAVFMLTGLVFTSYLNAINGQQGVDGTVLPSFLASLMIFLAPLLTMRLLAEEAREGTIEIMMTLPASDGQFVVGKFLAAWAYYSVLLAVTLVFQFIMNSVGRLDTGAVFSAYFGAWLLGGATMAVSLVFSALTENQVVAAFLGVAAMVVLWLSDSLVSLTANQPALRGLSSLLRELSVPSHYFSTLGRGIVRGEDLAYFLLVGVAALFITTRIVESRRWR